MKARLTLASLLILASCTNPNQVLFQLSRPRQERPLEINNITQTLTSDLAINNYVRDNFSYWDNMLSRSPEKVNQSKKGNCEDLAILQTYFLERAGHSAKVLTSIWGREGHSVAAYVKNSKLYYIENHYWERCEHHTPGINGPFGSVEEIAEKLGRDHRVSEARLFLRTWQKQNKSGFEYCGKKLRW
jgi:hypothetical protein